MKIIEIEPIIVANPPPSFGGRYFIFVKVKTDCGIEGVGEIYSPPFHPKAIPAMVEDVAERIFLGKEAGEIEKLSRATYASGFSLRPDPTLSAIFSGIEIALFDIIGKKLGVSVHQLLGGKIRQAVRIYTYLYPDEDDYESLRTYDDPDKAAERALYYVDAGFSAIKFDPAGPYTACDPRQLRLEDLQRSRDFVMSIRKAVGSKADILFGTHGQMTPASAIRLAKYLEEADPLWFEEPIPPDRPEEMALVARATSIPIATGERLVSKYEFARIIEHRAAAILQPALGRVGGIWEAKKIASMAEAFHIQMAPHLYCGPIEGVANIHLSASLPNFLIMESIQKWQGFYGELIHHGIAFDGGMIKVPQRPGLGIELNEALARAHPYQGENLHLDAHPPIPENR